MSPPSFAWPLPVPDSPDTPPVAESTTATTLEVGSERSCPLTAEEKEARAFAFWPQFADTMEEKRVGARGEKELAEEAHPCSKEQPPPELDESLEVATPATPDLQSARTLGCSSSLTPSPRVWRSPSMSPRMTLATKARLRLNLKLNSPDWSDEATTDQRSSSGGAWSSSPTGTCSYSSSSSSYEDDVDPAVLGGRDVFWSPLTTPMLELLDECQSAIPTKVIATLAPEPESVPRPPRLGKLTAKKKSFESVDCAFKAVVSSAFCDGVRDDYAGGHLIATLGSTGGCGTPQGSPRR